MHIIPLPPQQPRTGGINSIFYAAASLIDDNAELAEIAGAEFTVNYAMLY